MYKVIVEKRAAKEMRALPQKITNKITSALKGLETNPKPFGIKKLFGNLGWRIRVGNYRVLFEIDNKEKIVSVYRVSHRRDVYRF